MATESARAGGAAAAALAATTATRPASAAAASATAATGSSKLGLLYAVTRGNPTNYDMVGDERVAGGRGR